MDAKDWLDKWSELPEGGWTAVSAGGECPPDGEYPWAIFPVTAHLKGAIRGLGYPLTDGETF